MAANRSDKLSTGPNARPKDESIAQTGSGIPDDAGALNRDLDEAARSDREADEVFEKGKRRDDNEPGRRQPDTAEGDRDRVERELARQSDQKKR